MGLSWTGALLTFVLVAPEPIAIRFEPVTAATRAPGRSRAIVLIHGLRPHPIRDANVLVPDLSAWEKPGSAVVKALAPDSDVFALGYSQNRTIDEIARAPSIKQAVLGLRERGYSEIVLLGHSAGGLLARYYVENEPEGGVTKVIQVCAPNGGSSWGRRTSGVRESQEAFLTSLTKESRAASARERANRLIPPRVQFVCVVGVFAKAGDGFVRADSQWSPDLRRQGIPVVLLRSTHVTAMYSKSVAARLAELVREPQPRWSPAETEAVSSRLLSEK